MRKSVALLTGAALVGVLAACSSPAGPGPNPTDTNTGPEVNPITLRLASYAPPATNDSQAITWWAEELEKRTDGKVVVEIYFSEQLFKAGETLQGIGQGRADIGYSCDVYFPNELPLTNVSGIPFQSSEGDTQGRVWNKLFDEYQPYTDEWEKNGVALIGMLPTGTNTYWSKDPVTSMDDVKRATIRAVGKVGTYVEAIGQTPINLAGPDVYEAFQRGQISAAFGVAFDFGMSFKHYEVAPYVYETGFGTFASCWIAMNLDQFNALDESISQTILDLREPLMERAVAGFDATFERYCAELNDGGGTAARFPEEVTTEWRDALDLDTMIKNWQDATPGGAEYFAEYTRLLQELSPQSTQSSFLDFC